jgi:hypothetical protein
MQTGFPVRALFLARSCSARVILFVKIRNRGTESVHLVKGSNEASSLFVLWDGFA